MNNLVERLAKTILTNHRDSNSGLPWQQPWEIWIRIFYKTSEKFCLLPIHWDNNSKTLKAGKSLIRNSIWGFTFLYYLLDTIYQLATIATVNYNEMETKEALKLLVHGSSRTAAYIFTLGALVNFKLTVSLLNQISEIHRDLKESYYGDSNAVVNDGIVGYGLFALTVVHFQPLGPTLQHLQERQSIRYWGSRFLPGAFYNSFIGITLFGILELMVSYNAVFGTVYAGMQLFIYTQTSRYWLSILYKQVQQDVVQVREWELVKHLQLYRSLNVLNCAHNEACSALLWPLTQHALCLVHVLCNVVIIKCFPILPPPVIGALVLSILAFSGFEKSCFKGAADIYEISKKFKEKMCKNSCKKNRVIGRSLLCLKIKVGPGYHFKMSTFNTFIQAMVDNTINVMLVSEGESI